jgi:hypothetical protein
VTSAPDFDDAVWQPTEIVAKMRHLNLRVVAIAGGGFEWSIRTSGDMPLWLMDYGVSATLGDAKIAIVNRARELLTTTGPRWPKPNIPHEVPCQWPSRS